MDNNWEISQYKPMLGELEQTIFKKTIKNRQTKMEEYGKLISKHYLMKKQLAQTETSKNKQTTGGTRTGPAGSMRSDPNPDKKTMITSFQKRSRSQEKQCIFTNQITNSWLCNITSTVNFNTEVNEPRDEAKTTMSHRDPDWIWLKILHWVFEAIACMAVRNDKSKSRIHHQIETLHAEFCKISTDTQQIIHTE